MAIEIESSNPFGSVDDLDINLFEERVSWKLPADYRAYIRDHNGGLPRKRRFSTENEPEEFLRLEELYSLKFGPDHSRLDLRWSLAPEYDLGKFIEELSNYLTIGTATRGNVIVFHMKSGKIFCCEPDHEDLNESEYIATRMDYIANSFDEFLSAMKSDESVQHLQGDF